MDFIRYAERAAALVNADLPDEAALHDHLAEPVPALLLRPVLLAGQRRGLSRAAEGDGVGVNGCFWEFHRVPGETGASPLKLERGSVSFTGYPVKLRRRGRR